MNKSEKGKKIFETNGYIYVEKPDKKPKSRAFEDKFPEAKEVTLNWYGTKNVYWKLEITDDNFGEIFEYIRPVAKEYTYYFADVDGDLEGFNTDKVKFYKVYFYLPTYGWGCCDNYLASWLLKYLWYVDYESEYRGNLHTDEMLRYTEGLKVISKSLYKYVFSLLDERKTRREGLINSSFALDSEYSLKSLALKAYIQIHLKDNHPDLYRKHKRPEFDPDKFIKGQIGSEDSCFDPNDMPW